MHPGAIAATDPTRLAVTVHGTEFRQTYAELDAAANRLSHVLRNAGLAPGDHVAVCMENHPQYLAVIWGCHYAGLIYTACSSRLTSQELAYIVADSGARAMITTAHLAAQAADVLASTPEVELRLMLDGTIDGYDSFEDALAAQPPTALDEDRVGGIDMLYSSGTTGMPKGVKPRFTPTPLDVQQISVLPLLTLLFGVTDQSVYLSPAPLYHAAPLRFCLAMHQVGATVVVMPQFDAAEYLEAVAAHRATHSQVVPTMFVRLMKLPPGVRQAADVSSMQCIIHAAAPCPIPVKQQIIEWFGPIVHEYYAGTEGNGFVYCNSAMWLAHPGTVGMPLNCTVHIVDDDGHDVAPHETGTVYFEGGADFEYHNDPAKTAASRHPNGWTTLGDVGYLDDDGFLFLTDRSAYMIITGGVNVYPQEAENLLVTHSAVTDVAVFGVPNDEFGEEVKAVVQPAEMPATPEAAEALAGELIRFCREHLAQVKCPRTVEFRAELPRHPTGKLYKRLLKDEYWQNTGRAI